MGIHDGYIEKLEAENDELKRRIAKGKHMAKKGKRLGPGKDVKP